MNELLSNPAVEQVLWIIAIIVAAVVVLVVLRFVAKIAFKIIALGCALVVGAAIVFAALYFLGFLG